MNELQQREQQAHERIFFQHLRIAYAEGRPFTSLITRLTLNADKL